MEVFSLHSVLMTSLLALSSPASSVQESQIEVYEIPAVAGLWQVAGATDGCAERYNFGAKGHLKTTSGDEITYGKYRYVPQEEGLPVLAFATIYDNNAPDCSGNQIDQAGDTFATFVALNSRDEPTQMHWCIDKAGQNCSVMLNRVLP